MWIYTYTQNGGFADPLPILWHSGDHLPTYNAEGCFGKPSPYLWERPLDWLREVFSCYSAVQIFPRFRSGKKTEQAASGGPRWLHPTRPAGEIEAAENRRENVRHE